MSVVNYATGEITEPGTALAPVDKSNAASVITYLSQARDWLATCVEITGPAEIANVKAQIATAAEATKQLHLSKEIQLDAQEMVRRAEYALGKAIRKGQAEGTIRDRSHGGPREPYERGGTVVNVDRGADSSAISPKEFLPHGHDMAQVYAMSDDVEPEQLDAAIDEAKSEGNLSRANVVRKVKAKKQPDRSRDAKADVIADLASQGYTSRQMAPQIGVTDSRVRDIAREFGIDIPADRMVGKTRRIDHTAAVASAVTELDNWAGSLSFIDFAEVDMSERDEWVASLTNSLTELRRFIKQIKETTHV